MIKLELYANLKLLKQLYATCIIMRKVQGCKYKVLQVQRKNKVTLIFAKPKLLHSVSRLISVAALLRN